MSEWHPITKPARSACSPDFGGNFKPSRQRIRQRCRGQLGGRIRLRLRFPADVKRDAQIPVLRPNFLHGHDAGEAGVVVAALGVLVDVTGLDDRSMNGELEMRNARKFPVSRCLRVGDRAGRATFSCQGS